MGGRKGKEDRNSERRLAGEARRHTNHKFQEKQLPLFLTSFPFIELERNGIKSGVASFRLIRIWCLLAFTRRENQVTTVDTEMSCVPRQNFVDRNGCR